MENYEWRVIQDRATFSLKNYYKIMAQKRMFDKSILETDNFLNISLTAKALYFLLGMEADDEGVYFPQKSNKTLWWRTWRLEKLNRYRISNSL